MLIVNVYFSGVVKVVNGRTLGKGLELMKGSRFEINQLYLQIVQHYVQHYVASSEEEYNTMYSTMWLALRRSTTFCTALCG